MFGSGAALGAIARHNGTETKYYVFNGQRIAVRKGGEVGCVHAGDGGMDEAAV